MASLKNVIYLSNEDYETLVSTGTVTIDGDTLTYDENNVYVTPDKLASTTEDGLMSSNDKAKLDSLPTFGTSASKDFTTSVTSGSGDLVTSGAVYTAIDNLPEPMVYKGTLGTGGTISDLPTASSANEGFTYKVITDGTYASQRAKVGDVFISDGSEWTLVPSGDDIEDTWRQINVNGTQLLGTGISTGPVNFKNGSNITISGSGHDITISASQPTVNSGILTIQKNGTNVQTFNANQSNNVTANITVPTKVSELSDASSYINTGSTNQSKSGNLTLSGTTYFTGLAVVGDATTAARAVGDAPYKTKFLDFAGRTGALKHLNVFSGVGDYFYNADRKRTFTIKSTFKGSGADSDTYKADFYTWGVDDMGSYITYLFDWNLNNGWCVLPSKVSASTPAIIEIKNSTLMTYTDVLRLVLTGHGGYDSSSNYSGTLTDYKIEVCTSYANDTWVTVVDRNGVTDKIGNCPQYSLQTSSYTACYGIRLTITGCSVSGIGYQYIKITSMQLRDHRPDFTIPSSVGALSERGGSIYGDVVFDAKGSGQTLRPAVNDTGYLGGSSTKWHALYSAKVYGDSLYENGTSLADKYLGKTAKASDADKLDGQDSTYYLNYNNLANKPTIPTKTSELTNDSGFITSSYHDDAKQDVINDLNAIRSGAALGSTAVQPSEISNMVTTDTDQAISSNKTIAYGNKTSYTLNNGNTFDLSGNQYNYLQIGYNGVGMYSFGTSQFFPNSNDSRDLGTSSLKWRDLYLSGTAYTNNVKTNGTYLALQGVDGALTLGGKAAQFNVPIVPTGTTQSIGASERLWKDLYLSGNLTDGTNSISVANIASKSEIPTKTSELTNDSGFLTSESDTLGTVLNRGNSATTDIDLNNKDFFNAGTQKTTYIYSASQTPNTQYYWFKITPPPSNASDRYFLCSESDANYPRERGMFILDISNYSNGSSYNISLNNIGSTNYNDTLHLLNVAVDASGNVYVQCRATWASYLRFIRHNSNSTTQSYPSVGQADFGTVAGFTSLKMISDTGCIRILNGELDTNTTRTGHTQLFVDALIEGGTSLSNKYLGKSAKAADADKLDGHDSSYFYQASNPNGYTSNSGTITGISINGTSIATSGVANLATNGTYDASTNKIATMSDIPNTDNFLSLDGGTMHGKIMTGGFASPEEVVLGNGLDVSDVSSPSEPVTHYGGGYIRQDDDEDASIKYEYRFPKKSGTIALTSDVQGIEVIDLR